MANKKASRRSTVFTCKSSLPQGCRTIGGTLATFPKLPFTKSVFVEDGLEPLNQLTEISDFVRLYYNTTVVLKKRPETSFKYHHGMKRNLDAMIYIFRIERKCKQIFC